MNAWQKGFSRKMDRVREASQSRFDETAERIIQPVFEGFQQFSAEQGLQASAPLSRSGIRTFKFAMTENCYALLSFRMAGMENCEMLAEFAAPNQAKITPLTGSQELLAVDQAWVRGMFEQSLDQFADAAVELLASKDELEPALAVEE